MEPEKTKSRSAGAAAANPKSGWSIRAETRLFRMASHPFPMFYAYILESLAMPGEFYRGSTDDLKRRVVEH